MILAYPTHLSDTIENLKKDWPTDLIQKYVNYYIKREQKVSRGRTAYSDSSKTKTYKAEWAFESECYDSIKRFKTERQAEKYLERILNSKLWQDMTGGKPVFIDFIDSQRLCGRAYGAKIELSRKVGMNNYTLLHELAHCAGHMHHDVSFRNCLLRLVSRFIGRAEAKVLKKKFREQGLQMTIRSTIQSPDQWLENYEKMSRLRQKIAA